MATVSSGSKAERFGFIAEHGSALGVRYLCAWLQVSRSGYYKWKHRPESPRAARARTLSIKIEQLYYQHETNYGSPRIYAALRAKGLIVNLKPVERIMREMGLLGKAARIYRQKAAPKRFYAKLPNLRLELGSPTEINQQWVGDLTYLKVGKDYQYLAFVLDLFSRRVIGWSLGNHKTAELTREAIRQAIRYRRLKKGLIFHTERGPEYGAYLIQNELKRHGIASSMNRPRYVTDNAQMESFFQSLKRETYHGIHFNTESELRIALSDYMMNYYNKKRAHSALGYISPNQYECINN
ncbi:IS3 family transposase [Reinekea forsetii]|nr:IS3 family transposase [Reinekea forsetii]